MRKARRVFVPEFEIFSNPIIHLSDIKNREASVSYITGQMMIVNGRDNVKANREYIAGYIKEHKIINNLKQAIQQSCPEYEDTLNKLLVLK